MTQPTLLASGEQCGRWTVLSFSGAFMRAGRLRRHWRCRCPNGHEQDNSIDDLQARNTQGPRCHQCIAESRNIEDWTGQSLNGWTIRRFIERRGDNYLWECECKCGTLKTINIASLKSGASKSCGCARKAFTPEQDKQNAADYAGTIPTTDLAARTGHDVSTVIESIIRGGEKIRAIKDRPAEWNAEAIEARRSIKREYWPMVVKWYEEDHETTYTIAERLDTHQSTIWRLLNRLGCKMRQRGDRKCRYYVKSSAFDRASYCHDAAYFVGLIMADGCVTYRGKSAALHISLSGEDGRHLEALRAFLRTEHPIYESSPKHSAWQQKTAYRLTITSLRLVESLAKYGIVPNKSMTAKVIGLEDNVHFWRGMVDGDGYLSIANSGFQPQPLIGLVGSKPSMEQFSAFVRKHTAAIATVRPLNSIWTVSTKGRYAWELIRILYGNGRTALPRKQAIATQILTDFLPNGRPASAPEKNDYSWVTAETILEAKELMGTWKRVAASLEMCVTTLWQFRKEFGLDIRQLTHSTCSSSPATPHSPCHPWATRPPHTPRGTLDDCCTPHNSQRAAYPCRAGR